MGIFYISIVGCTKPPNALLIAMPILAGIIGVGLILLIIWRILTSFYDKIEYARFEHETKHPKWNRVCTCFTPFLDRDPYFKIFSCLAELSME